MFFCRNESTAITSACQESRIHPDQLAEAIGSAPAPDWVEVPDSPKQDMIGGKGSCPPTICQGSFGSSCSLADSRSDLASVPCQVQLLGRARQMQLHRKKRLGRRSWPTGEAGFKKPLLLVPPLVP